MILSVSFTQPHLFSNVVFVMDGPAREPGGGVGGRYLWLTAAAHRSVLPHGVRESALVRDCVLPRACSC